MESTHIPGYVQVLSYSPLIVILITEKQLDFYLDRVKFGRAVLYFDATGSVVKNFSAGKPDVYYYAIVIKSETAKESPIPVA